MPVPASINDLSTTAGSNSPPGSESPATLDDYARAHASFIAQLRDSVAGLSEAVLRSGGATGAAIIPSGTTAQRPGSPANGYVRYNTDNADFEAYIGGAWVPRSTFTKAVNEATIVSVASAATTNIGVAAANTINITGTTTITAFDTVASGARRILVFAGVLTLTYNATSLILPGAANITTAAGDVAEFVSLGGGNWRCISYQRASGTPLGSVFSKEFVSAEQTITAGGLLNLTHGLGVKPKHATLSLKCVIADQGYSVGEETELGWGPQDGNLSYGANYTATDSIISVRIGATGRGFIVINKTTGAVTDLIATANWRIVVRAWA